MDMFSNKAVSLSMPTPTTRQLSERQRRSQRRALGWAAEYYARQPAHPPGPLDVPLDDGMAAARVSYPRPSQRSYDPRAARAAMRTDPFAL